jgi:tetratricopeptide (TPR) repeat protein
MKRHSLIILTLLAVGCNLDPNRTKADYLAKGHEHFKQHDYTRALSMYRKAIETDRLYGEAYLHAGIACTRLQRWDEAVRHLERAVERLPDNLEAYSNLANVYLLAYGADPKVRRPILGLLQSLSAELHKRFPESYDDVRVQAYIALFTDQRAAAIEEFAKAHRISSQDPNLTLAYVQTLQSDGQRQLAEQVAEKAIAGRPDALQLYFALFSLYRESKRPADADRTLRLKIKNNPQNPDGYLELAAWYFATGRYPEMLDTLRQISSNAKDFASAPMLVGDFYLRTGMLPQAEEEYRRGVQQGGALKRFCQKRMVEVLVKQKNTDEADKIVEELLHEDSQDPEAIALKASVTVAKENKADIASAIQSFQSVLPKMPTDFVLRYQYARALLLSGDVQSAILQCEESLQLRPDYVWPQVVLAHLSLRAGKVASAGQLVKRLSSNPGINVPFDTAGQRPQEQPTYELILGINPPIESALNGLVR